MYRGKQFIYFAVKVRVNLIFHWIQNPTTMLKKQLKEKHVGIFMINQLMICYQTKKHCVCITLIKELNILC